MNWFLFTSTSNAVIADLQIAANETICHPENPQEHYSSIGMLKVGGVEIEGIVYICGFPALDEANGYTTQQIIDYLQNVVIDHVAEWNTNWFDEEEL